MFSLQAMSGRSVASNVTALLAWIDELGKLGLDAGTGGFDGQSLNEIGITNGALTIDDRRSGTEWKFTQISLNLNRPKAGGVALTVLSESQERPWVVSAALSPAPQGHRRLQFEARKVVLDDLLALRMAESEVPFRYAGFGLDRRRHRGETACRRRCRARSLRGRFDRQSGRTRASNSDHQRRVRPGLELPTRRTLRVPFKVTAGAARYHVARRICRARATRRQLDVRARRRMGRARSADRR